MAPAWLWLILSVRMISMKNIYFAVIASGLLWAFLSGCSFDSHGVAPSLVDFSGADQSQGGDVALDGPGDGTPELGLDSAPDQGLDAGVDLTSDAGLDAPTDLPLQDLPQLDVLLPDLPLPDMALPDQQPPDLMQPDLPLPDMALPDLPPPDLPPPDQMQADQMQADQMKPDQSPPPPKCDTLFGKVDGYKLCQEKADRCTFYRIYWWWVSCDDICGSHKCLSAGDNDFFQQCKWSSTSCSSPKLNSVCTCSKY